MIDIIHNLNEMFEFANVDNNDLECGEDLEDGEIFDDEAEAESKSESSKVESNRNSKSAPATPTPVAKSVLKNDANNVPEFGVNITKKNDKFSNSRWTDENSKKETKDGNFENDKRFKEKKMKRKKTKEEDSENDGPPKFKGKKRKTSFDRELEKLEDSDYIDEDDDEMLNIRGASPGKWMDLSDEEEANFGGVGGVGGDSSSRGDRGARRRGAFRGGRLDKNSRREKLILSARGKRRGKGGGMRGGKKRGEDICIFHMQGKCHRGNDCPFSHNMLPPKKMELCKFYLMDCCAKKDKCLYMHSEFPCKYFHTGLKCFAGNNCKFSHGKLTDTLRAVLNKTFGPPGKSPNEFSSKHQAETGYQRQHLETAPKEILGDFPRLREATRNLKRENKIPSLFDIKVSPPKDMRSQSDSDGNHTPMPSPTHQPNNKDFFRDSMEREQTPPGSSTGERRREPREHHHHHHHHHKTDKSSRTPHSQKKESRRSERGSEDGRERREKREKREKEGGRRSSREEDRGEERSANCALQQDATRRQSYSPPSTPAYDEEAPVPDRLRAPEPDLSSNEFPSHLPKKQRELFLRIQQQQRQAENSEKSNGEDDDQDSDNTKQEDDWYSSDEESTPLTTILKSLANQRSTLPSSQSPSQNQHQNHDNHHHHHHHHHHQQPPEPQMAPMESSNSSLLPASIPDIDINEVSALLSKVKQHFQTASRLKVRDPRLRVDNDQSPSSEPSSAAGSSSSSRALISESPPPSRGVAASQLSPTVSSILSTAASRHNQHQQHQQQASRIGIDRELEQSIGPDPEQADGMSLSSLPFKPAPVHSAANEIDASINSHSPIAYKLLPLQPSRPDYSAIQTMPKGGALDPRWRKAVRFSEESGLTSRRDPRHRLADDCPRNATPAPSVSSADPRQRLAAMLNASSASSAASNALLPPSTPRYDDDHQSNTGMRNNHFPAAQMDVSMYCPPTPRLDDEPVAPSPPLMPSVRPNDPRQRHHLMGQHMNMNQQQHVQTPIGSVYEQMRQQQVFMPTQQAMMFDPDSRLRAMYSNDMPNNINRQPQYNFK